MKANEYRELPDYMTSKELSVYFQDFIAYVNTSDNIIIVDALEGLSELASRQWHTYELINTDIKKEIEVWLNSIWDLKSLLIVDYVTSIIGHLGLQESYKMVKDAVNHKLDDDIRELIEDTINEFGNNIEDPYIGMRSSVKDKHYHKN